MQRNKRIRGRQRGRSGKVLLPALFAILLGAVGAFVTLVAFGQIKVDAPGLARFFGGDREEEAMIASDMGPSATADELMYTPPTGYGDEDWVMLVIKPIKAYSMITAENVQFARNQRAWPRWIRQDQWGKDWLTRPSQAKGRVAKYDIPAGYIIPEGALMPEGTRAGLMGAIPEGQRGIVVNAGDLGGAHSLRQFDHVDVFATFTPDAKEFRDLAKLGRGIQPLVTGKLIRTAGVPRPDIRVIVENAVVIQPVERRAAANPERDRIIEELTLSAAPEGVAALTEALKAGATLYAVVRPGADPNEKLSLQASKVTAADLYGIEQIVGEKRSMIVLPDGTN